MYFTRSAWLTTYPNDLGSKLRKLQGGNKPPRLLADLISFFTKRGDNVIDPMCGVGSSLLGAALTGRNALGVELNPKWKAVYEKVCEAESIRRFSVMTGDCILVLDRLEAGSFDFAVVDPPYREDTKWERTMCDGSYRKTRSAGVPEKYSESERDFGNIMEFDKFLGRILLLAGKINRVLKDGKYFAVFSKDEYQRREFREKSSMIAETVRKAGFEWKGKITWYQAGAKLRPYGVPYSYVPNITDQKILIFRKSA